MTPEGERIAKALATLPPSDYLSLPHAVFNFLNDGFLSGETHDAMATALNLWAIQRIGYTELPSESESLDESEGGTNGSRWADDGGSNG